MTADIFSPMATGMLLRFASVMVFMAGTTACSEPTHTICARPGYPAISAEIRTLDGQPAAAGARVVLNGRDTAWSAPSYAALVIDVGDESSIPHADIRVEKPWYQSVAMSDILLDFDGCGLARATTVRVELALLPGAPPVRSLYVGRRGVMAFGSVESQLAAVLDAEPGVSDAVTWWSSDTTVAVVDERGLMRTRCRTSHRTAFMRATLVADTMIRDSLVVGVYPGSYGC